MRSQFAFNIIFMAVPGAPHVPAMGFLFLRNPHCDEPDGKRVFDICDFHLVRAGKVYLKVGRILIAHQLIFCHLLDFRQWRTHVTESMLSKHVRVRGLCI